VSLINGDDIDSDKLEDLVRQGRIAVEESEEEGYVLFPGISFETPEEVVDFYRENVQEYVEEEGLAVYGNSGELEEGLAEKDTWAAFRTEEQSEKDRGEWAVDAMNTLEKFPRDIVVDPYERAVESLSATTLYVVARAESGGEIGSGMYSFHHGIVRYLRGQRPEYPEGDMTEQIEAEIEEVRDELEEAQEEKQMYEEALEETDRELEQVEQEMEEVEDEIELYEGLIDALRSVEGLEEDVDVLTEQLGRAADRSEFAEYIQTLQRNIENLDSRLQQVEYGEERVEELEDRMKDVEQETEFQDVHIQVEEEEMLDTAYRLEGLEERVDMFQEGIEGVEEETEDIEEELMDFEDRLEDVEKELERGHGLTWVWRGTKRWYGRRKQALADWLESEEEETEE